MTHKRNEFPNPADPAYWSPYSWIFVATETARRAEQNARAPEPSTKQTPKPTHRETTGLFSRLLTRFQSA